MSTVYDEGPYRNWAAVNFPSEKMQVFVWPSASDSDGETGTFVPYPEGRELSGAAEWNAIWRGDTSGAQIDLRNLPPGGGQLSLVPNFSPPPCTFTWVNAYDLDGNAVSGNPNTGYSITATQFSALTSGTATWSGSQCDLDGNAPTLTGTAFITGETLTAVSE